MTREFGFAHAVALVTIAVDWTLLGYLDGLVFTSITGLPTAAVPFWLAMPRALFFLLLGAAYALLPMPTRQVARSAVVYIVLMALYYFFVRAGMQWWVAPDLYAYSVAFLPYLVIPPFFSAGLIIGGRTKRRFVPAHPARYGT